MKNYKKQTDIKKKKFNILNSFNMLNIFEWPLGVIDDIQTINVIKDALKEEYTKIQFKTCKYELRHNGRGTIYTVINIPEELLPMDKQNMIWPWLLEQLKEIDLVLMECRLSDLLEPVVEKINDENASAYLIKLVPMTYYIEFNEFIKWIGKLTTVTMLLLVFNYLVKMLTNNSILFYLKEILHANS